MHDYVQALSNYGQMGVQLFFLASAYSNLTFFRNVRRIEASPEAAVECIEVEAPEYAKYLHVTDREMAVVRLTAIASELEAPTSRRTAA